MYYCSVCENTYEGINDAMECCMGAVQTDKKEEAGIKTGDKLIAKAFCGSHRNRRYPVLNLKEERQ